MCEICDTLTLAQPLVSRHLKQLKEAKILESHKEGKWTIYTLENTPSRLLNAYLDELACYVDTLPPLHTCSLSNS